MPSAVGDDGGAAVIDQPLAVLGHQAVVDGEVGVELGQGGGHDALPLNAHDDCGLIGIP